MLDAIFLLTTFAVFALIGLVARGVEKLGPPAGGPAQPGSTRREERP